MSVLDTLEICFSANLSGVDSQLSALKGKLSGLSGSGRTYGRALSDGLASGIRSGSSAVNAAVSAMVNSATRKIRSLLSIHSPSKVTRQYGAYFGEGFAGGISESTGEAVDAAEDMAASAAKKIRALPEGTLQWRAELPEENLRWHAELTDVNLKKGVSQAQSALEKLRGMADLRLKVRANGLSGGAADILSGGVSAMERAAEALGAVNVMKSAPLPERVPAEDVGRAVQEAVDRALGNVQLTVPLNVDGIKLGEASIRGINAVTRSAGRLLLNI